MLRVKLTKSPNPKKKFRVTFPDGKKVDFGGAGYSDYTSHKDPERKKRYLARHGHAGEDWSKKGVRTAGFWSRWLLWSEPSMTSAKRLLYIRFGIRVTRGSSSP